MLFCYLNVLHCVDKISVVQLFIVILKVILPSVVMLIVLLSVILPSFVMLSVILLDAILLP